MNDMNILPQYDDEILFVIYGFGEDGIEPEDLVNALLDANYTIENVIEAIQLAIEHGKILLNSDGRVVITIPKYK